MFRPALLRASIPRRLPRAAQARRFLSTAPPSQKSRSWKSSAARWGVAVAGIYYYNTSNVFAEEPAFGLTTKPSPDDDSSNVPTLETLAHERQARIARQRSTLASIAADDPLHAGHESQPQSRLDVAPSAGITSDAEPEHGAVGIGSPEDLEEEANQEGAFNPETGEINWDCPCLGGMAHGPCGEEFKGAFSCFVYSTEEPKGMDCIEKFKGMQNCFRAHPDIYGSELEGDEDDDELDTPIPASGEPIDPKADHPVPSPSPAAAAPESSPAPSSPTDTPKSSPPPEAPVSSIPPPASTEPHPPASEDHELAGTKKEEAERVRESPRKVSETTSLVMESDAVPRQAHDAKDR